MRAPGPVVAKGISTTPSAPASPATTATGLSLREVGTLAASELESMLKRERGQHKLGQFRFSFLPELLPSSAPKAADASNFVSLLFCSALLIFFFLFSFLVFSSPLFSSPSPPGSSKERRAYHGHGDTRTAPYMALSKAQINAMMDEQRARHRHRQSTPNSRSSSRVS